MTDPIYAKLAAKYGIDNWPEAKRAIAYQHLSEMLHDLEKWPLDREAIIRSTRDALEATRDSKDVECDDE
jgi:hypothetical protein